jgi:hypothetical protein
LTGPCFRAVFEDINEREETVLLVVDGSRPVAWRDKRRSRGFLRDERADGRGSGTNYGLSI